MKLVKQENFESLATLAASYAKQGNMQKALQTLKKTRPQASQTGIYYLHLGHIYRNLNEISKAIDCYKKAEC